MEQLNTLVLNPAQCYSIKSKRELYLECPHKKKLGDYCGVHTRSNKVIRIDDILSKYLDSNEYTYPELNDTTEKLKTPRIISTLKNC